MDLIFWLVSLGALAIILVGLVIAWFYFFRIKRWYLYGLAADLNKFPGRLSVRLMSPFAWRKPVRSDQRVAAWKALGFVELGGFTVEEIPNARLFALQHPETGAIGIVHERDEPGTWSDALFFLPGEGNSILASSILKSSHFRFLPGDPKIHKPDATEQELLTAVHAAAGKAVSGQAVAAETFGPLMEQAYANAIDARLLESLDDNEIRRLLKDSGQVCGGGISDREFARLKKLLPLALANELRLVCATQFMKETRMPASDWQHARERLLVIHDRTPLSGLVERPVYGAFCTEALKSHLARTKRESGTPREAFARLNATLSASERYKKIGEVTRPIAADIYRAPIERATA